jgi:pSer/pThr/pTyr-binding forkhead associated (FHA) protein
MYTLNLYQQGQLKKSFQLADGTNVIGRWDPSKGSFPDIDLEMFDEEVKVSRKHAVIFVKDSECFIEDLASLNGTFLNRGPKIPAGNRIQVTEGDEIVIGKLFLRIIKD